MLIVVSWALSVAAFAQGPAADKPIDCPPGLAAVRDPRDGTWACQPKLGRLERKGFEEKHPDDPCPKGYFWHLSHLSTCEPVVCTDEPSSSDLKGLCPRGMHEHLASGGDWTKPILCVEDYVPSHEGTGGKNPRAGGCDLCLQDEPEHRGRASGGDWRKKAADKKAAAWRAEIDAILPRTDPTPEEPLGRPKTVEELTQDKFEAEAQYARALEDERRAVAAEKREARLQKRLATARPSGELVLVDGYHGQEWAGLEQALQDGRYAHSRVGSEKEWTKLARARVLILAFDDTDARHPISDAQLDTVRAFVEHGGSLLCAGLSLAHASVLERIGARLKFRLGGPTGEPASFPAPLMTGVRAIQMREPWVPSQVELDGVMPQPLVLDREGLAMAGAQSVGSGRVVVFGHMKLARDNPRVVLRALHWLSHRPGSPE